MRKRLSENPAIMKAAIEVMRKLYIEKARMPLDMVLTGACYQYGVSKTAVTNAIWSMKDASEIMIIANLRYSEKAKILKQLKKKCGVKNSQIKDLRKTYK